ncbi:hypothetical protein BGW36DRAFT_371117 [Talaromyces proteolyticus]|uniref:Zn(2)-C6 fungal-type domain-containing protein n=1 Tax=Talaromyces proteolyticus TaxID=1131652 RepID=A0AAD4KXX3_9EURO|nr:uncharacterized protein BGW36DRAFT_371117 [Talaromyces proteolyticus]KAH8701567.1 hypothetical protein BGW36DRAFT_371117 [Talaromyces proteolyticus]
MPGVPSGRACEGCRKQKKKCDEKMPSCSRCLRLKMPCIGSGQRRFKFQEERRFFTSPDNEQQVTKSSSPIQSTTRSNSSSPITWSIPSNELTFLTSIFIQAFKPSTDLRYNLIWNYGGFIADIPQRLGINEALDGAVYAVTAAHSSFCLYKDISIEALSRYSRALQMLRLCLDDPIKAATSETLCAVMLLLICQAFIGTGGRSFTGHCEGAAQILKARGYSTPKDEFEAKLILSLRGPVLFEALWNDKIELSPNEWSSLVENDYDTNLPEGQLMLIFSRVPFLMHRGRNATEESEFTALREEIRPMYDTSRSILSDIQSCYHDINRIPIAERSRYLHAYHQRIYSLALTIVTVLNCISSALDPGSIDLQSDAIYMVNEILALCDESSDYRPLGASCNILALMVAYVATTDPITKCLVESAFTDYQTDYPQRTLEGYEASLEIVSRHLRLLNSEA